MTFKVGLLKYYHESVTVSLNCLLHVITLQPIADFIRPCSTPYLATNIAISLFKQFFVNRTDRKLCAFMHICVNMYVQCMYVGNNMYLTKCRHNGTKLYWPAVECNRQRQTTTHAREHH